MRKVEQSILAPAIVESRVIPYGVDRTIFRLADRIAARESLGIPRDQHVILFAANGIRRNVFKDYALIHSVAKELGPVATNS